MCCATHCMVHGVHGYVCHLLRGTCSVCTFAVCYGYATCVWTCRTVCTGMHSTWDWRVCVPLTSRHLLSVYVCRVLRLCSLVRIGILWSPLHSTWVSRVCAPLTSRHLLCVYVCRLLRLCCLYRWSDGCAQQTDLLHVQRRARTRDLRKRAASVLSFFFSLEPCPPRAIADAAMRPSPVSSPGNQENPPPYA